MKSNLAFIILISIVFVSCKNATFIHQSGKNQFSLEDEFVSCVNLPHKIESITFGDFVFASNMKTWKKINGHAKIPYKHVLLYAKTNTPAYDYFIIMDSVSEVETGYTATPKFINGRYITLIISNNAPAKDAEFIYEGILGL